MRGGTRGLFNGARVDPHISGSVCHCILPTAKRRGPEMAQHFLQFSLLCVNPFSARIVFRRQNLTSLYVRFWRLKTIPALKESNKLYWSQTHNIVIQMKRKYIYHDFKLKKTTFGLHGLYKNISASQGLNVSMWNIYITIHLAVIYLTIIFPKTCAAPMNKRWNRIWHFSKLVDSRSTMCRAIAMDMFWDCSKSVWLRLFNFRPKHRRHSQLQVGENYSDLTKWSSTNLLIEVTLHFYHV